MKKPKITMDIVKEDTGYSAFTSVRDQFIGTQGDDFDQLKQNILEAVNLAFQEQGFTYAMDEIILRPDLPSFFNFYKVLNVKALSERIGMNQSLLAQYINGAKKPSANQTKRILLGVQQVGKELSSIQFLI
ncbi:helix-turn-helix domain-containing protein [Dyadobacter sandarakinus]|uniref:Helix-turn-helix transcriptional regulator n=1 Tax=Dyadobacter sandarakinus TaxID=2747268 RepID=A0ABX7I9U9_9BACT|nr:helix-turn-helix transcriptional regulator [Dyadobacter sandarakinus]QRR02560.1 helix-turn-helix transcriptional regulator [Dyadobacter sandarakinus]